MRPDQEVSTHPEGEEVEPLDERHLVLHVGGIAPGVHDDLEGAVLSMAKVRGFCWHAGCRLLVRPDQEVSTHPERQEVQPLNECHLVLHVGGIAPGVHDDLEGAVLPLAEVLCLRSHAGLQIAGEARPGGPAAKQLIHRLRSLIAQKLMRSGKGLCSKADSHQSS